MQVAIELPLRDLLVGGLDLAALDLDVLVEVVAVTGLAQRVAKDLAALELPGGVEQVGRNGLDARGRALLRRELMEVGGVGLARVEATLDAVEARPC